VSFGASLRLHRQQAGLLLRELAEPLDLSVSFLSDVERDYRRFPERLVLSAEEQLGLSVGELALDWLQSDPELLKVVRCAAQDQRFEKLMRGGAR